MHLPFFKIKLRRFSDSPRLCFFIFLSSKHCVPFYQHYRFCFTLLSVFRGIVMFLSRMSHCYQCKVFQHSGAEIANLCREFQNLTLCARRILIIIYIFLTIWFQQRKDFVLTESRYQSPPTLYCSALLYCLPFVPPCATSTRTAPALAPVVAAAPQCCTAKPLIIRHH